MQFFATVLGAAAAAAVAAVPVVDIAYKVCSFQAGCVAHSASCIVKFNVWKYGSNESPPGNVCTANTQSRQDGTMNDIMNGQCQQTARTFNLTFCARGATLRVTGPVTTGTNLTGETLLPTNQWKFEDNGVANLLTYYGPTELDLAVTR